MTQLIRTNYYRSLFVTGTGRSGLRAFLPAMAEGGPSRRGVFTNRSVIDDDTAEHAARPKEIRTGIGRRTVDEPLGLNATYQYFRNRSGGIDEWLRRRPIRFEYSIISSRVDPYKSISLYEDDWASIFKITRLNNSPHTLRLAVDSPSQHLCCLRKYKQYSLNHQKHCNVESTRDPLAQW